MSKAEEYAYSVYPEEKKGCIYDIARYSIIQGYKQAKKDLCQDAYVYKRCVKYGYERGYNQAKKDLALTVDDIKDRIALSKEIRNAWYGQGFSEDGLSQEVLKRFLESKRV